MASAILRSVSPSNRPTTSRKVDYVQESDGRDSRPTTSNKNSLTATTLSSQAKAVTINGDSSSKPTIPEIKIQPNGGPVGVAGTTPARPTTAGWRKIRTAVTMSNVIQQPVVQKKKKATLERQDSFIKKFSTNRGGAEDDDEDIDTEAGLEAEKRKSARNKALKTKQSVIEPQGNLMMTWLTIVTFAVLYNIWTCICREAFDDIRINYDAIWFACDALVDLIYILDIVVQLRTSYLENGLSVDDSQKLAIHYVKSRYFVLDILSIMPLDFIQLAIGIHPIIRFPRFLKLYRAIDWKDMVENRTSYPNLWRVTNLVHVLLVVCHWFAAFYYFISEAENFRTSWCYPYPNGSFSSVTRKYLYSFYWATLTITTIGNTPSPVENWEYLFNSISYLIGVFVFAAIVGQVSDVITNRNATRQEFERILDNAKSYMQLHDVHQELQRRVMRWYDYAWSRGRTSGSDDASALRLLPDKLKTELALHVNLETLKKVTIFQECKPEFLHDLVLKMRAYIFTPGDLVCRKGEVAREMFIIADGVLEVISDSGEVLAKMSTGNFFGEIGILNIDGGINRRTADVRSLGYAELFVLSKEDVLSALRDHPDAEVIMMQHARARLADLNAKRRPTNAEITPIKAIEAESVSVAPLKESIANDSMSNVLRAINVIVEERIKEAQKQHGVELAVLEKNNLAKDKRIEELEAKIRQLQKDSTLQLPIVSS